MNTKTITYLNDLNQAFYDEVAESFSLSRSEAWEGWKQLLPFLRHLPSHTLTLDLGCGNGRFATFLTSNLITQNWEYVGVDNNSTFLEIAKKEIKVGRSFKKVDFFQNDLVGNLLAKWSLKRQKAIKKVPDEQKCDLTVAFAILHHIPSFEMRQKFLEMMNKTVKADGLIIISTWEFIKIRSLMQMAISAHDFSVNQINISKSELEEYDYFLTWERESSAIRYCHYINESEMRKLLATTGLEVISTFSADGKTNNLNTYYVLKKTQPDR